MKKIFGRIAVAPFEAAFFFILSAFGVTGLMDVGPSDPVDILLPHWEAYTFSSIALLAGLLGLLGIVTARGRWEILGLYLLNGIIVSRLILFGHYLGYGKDFINSGIFDVALIVAAWIRTRTIRKHKIIVRIRKTDDHDLDILK